MNPNDVPMGDRILPNEECAFCGAIVKIVNEADDEEETMFVACPNKEDETDEHTEYSGQPKVVLKAWGWKFEDY